MRGARSAPIDTGNTVSVSCRNWIVLEGTVIVFPRIFGPILQVVFRLQGLSFSFLILLVIFIVLFTHDEPIAIEGNHLDHVAVAL